jgi:hypothetical protein
MYKSIQNKKYYLAINTFKKEAKTVSKVYYSGIRIFESDDMKTYSLVINLFRIMFGVKKIQLNCCNK